MEREDANQIDEAVRGDRWEYDEEFTYQVIGSGGYPSPIQPRPWGGGGRPS